MDNNDGNNDDNKSSVLYETIQFCPSIIYTDKNLFKSPTNNQKIDYNKDIFLSLYKDTIQARLTFYTDGSKNNNCVGYAVYCPSHNVIIRKKNYSYDTISTAETLGIRLAVEYILDNNVPYSIIFTDSESTLKAISVTSSRKIKCPIILDLKRLLHNASTKELDILLIWIPGHIGIIGNEIADFLAKQAIDCGDDENIELSFLDF